MEIFFIFFVNRKQLFRLIYAGNIEAISFDQILRIGHRISPYVSFSASQEQVYSPCAGMLYKTEFFVIINIGIYYWIYAVLKQFFKQLFTESSNNLPAISPVRLSITKVPLYTIKGNLST